MKMGAMQTKKTGARRGGRFRALQLFIVVILAVEALCISGCSLDYTDQADMGAFSLAYGKRQAFINEYRWDGSEENRVIRIPEEYEGRKVTALGGYFGRGLPMPFYIDMQEVYGNGKTESDWGSQDYTVDADEIIYEDFTLILGAGIKDVEYVIATVKFKDENAVVAVVPRVYVVCDENNKTYYSQDGKLYHRQDGTLVEELFYTQENE